MVCDDCGKPYGISEWPYCPHGTPTFQVDAYSSEIFDIGLGTTVSSSHDRAAKARRMGLFEKKPPDDTPTRRRDTRDRQMAKREIYHRAS